MNIKNTVIFSEQDVSPLLEEVQAEYESSNAFVAAYISNVFHAVNDDPAQYRSFGAYWWPIKRLWVARGMNSFGVNQDPLIDEHVSLRTDELTLLAAYRYQMERINNGLIYSEDHIMYTEAGDTYRYVIEDIDIESRILEKQFRQVNG